MMVLFPRPNIDWVGKRFIFFAISGCITLAGLIMLPTRGLNLALDFTGGTLLQAQFSKTADIGTVRKALEADGIEAQIQTYVERNSFAIKVKGSQDSYKETGERIKAALAKNMPDNAYQTERMEFVGPAVGRDLSKKAVMAIVLSLFGIIIYVAFRFNNLLWGAMGVVALGHDVFVALTYLSFSHREVDLVIVAALLSIAGYSINDTVVIFDRMREHIHLNPRMKLKELINTSINDCFGRTLITNLTVVGVLVILYFMAGPIINDFAAVMLAGAICGTYSTIAIATPLVYQWQMGGKKEEEDPGAASQLAAAPAKEQADVAAADTRYRQKMAKRSK